MDKSDIEYAFTEPLLEFARKRGLSPATVYDMMAAGELDRKQIKIPCVDDADENVAKIIALVDAKVLDHEPAPFMIDHEPGKPGRGSIDAGVLDSVRSSSTSPQKHGADDVVRWVDSPATDSCCRLSAHATLLPRDETSLARSPEIEAPSYS